METYQKALSKHHYCYKVVSISPDKGNTYQVAFQFDHHQVILNLASQVIERYGLSIGQVVDREELDALKDQEQVSRAYQLALKYLTYKDYTYAKMQKKLKQNATSYSQKNHRTVMNGGLKLFPFRY